MQFTQEDLNTLKDALLTGASSVSVQGRTITFRSQDDILRLISIVQQSLDQESGARPANKIKATFSKT